MIYHIVYILVIYRLNMDETKTTTKNTTTTEYPYHLAEARLMKKFLEKALKHIEEDNFDAAKACVRVAYNIERGLSEVA